MKAKIRTLSGTLAVLCSLTAAALAQTPPAWTEIRNQSFGRGGAACTHASDDGDVFCFGLRCAANGGPEWFTYQVGGDSIEGDTHVNLIVDGRRHTTLSMKQGKTPQGEWSFSLPYDHERHRSAIELLKSGSGLYVLVGGASGAQLSLRGSAREIDRALAMCRPGGVKPAAARPSAVKEPHDAVLALAARQGCTATEAQIVSAITRAGFPDWDANQYVVTGTANGTLQRVGGGEDYRYRVAGCRVEAAPLAVDPKAKQLSLTADQLPQAVRAEIRNIAAMCGKAFQTGGRNEKALQAEDIDGDGTYDFLLDHARFCPSAIATMCGASHCPMTLFVSAKGAWRRFDFILQGYREFTANGFLFDCGGAGARKAGVFMENGRLTQRDCR